MSEYAIEMLNITKRFPGIIANDNITLRLKKGEIHALLGENGAGKSTLMSVLFGLYQPEEGEIRKDGKKVEINNPNDANDLGIGMVHQHFKLVECFSVLDNIILGVEPRGGILLKKDEARKKIMDLSQKYHLAVDPDAIVENITVGMQQRTEILKMLYRDNDILIFDEPTAVLTVQEIAELMKIMKELSKEGKSILFISHKLNEIMEVADRCTVLRKGKYVGTVETKDTTPEKLSAMMVGRNVSFHLEKKPAKPGEVVLDVRNIHIEGHGKKDVIRDVSFTVRRGEIVCIAGIDGNGQTELIYGLSGLMPLKSGSIFLKDKDVTKESIRQKSILGMSHIPEDRHKHGLVLDYTLEDNLVLQKYFESEFTGRFGILNKTEIRKYAARLISEYDVRSGQGVSTITRAMSGGNQQKAIIAREIDKDPELLIAVQPTRGVDIGAIEFIHKQLVRERDAGKAVLLVSLELDEVMDVPDRILVMHDGEFVGEFKPDEVTMEDLGLYMTGAKRQAKFAKAPKGGESK
ncbi:MAG: ABC transporter ATP-binding protein [Lachnospiraceae bacterium]|nr:ABC transporter ATP-binding protein [Lachnospiraceae bacterium]